MKKIESKVKETILQDVEDIIIGGERYTAAQPSIATLILVSEAVSRLPQLSFEEDKLVEGCLANAKNCAILGDIIAILILGAKHITEKVEVQQIQGKRYLFGLINIRRKKTEVIEVNKKDELAQKILQELSPREIHNLLAQLLAKMQLGDFFAITTFLHETNMMKPTRKVEEN